MAEPLNQGLVAYINPSDARAAAEFYKQTFGAIEIMPPMLADDAQSWWDRAVAAGCTVTMPLDKQFWGDIYGQLIDPFGISWAIGQAT